MAAAGRDIDIDKLMSSGRVLKDDTATTVVRTMWSGRDVVIKRYNYRGIWRMLASVVRGSRAKRAWRNGRLLKRIGIPTPEPLTFVEIKRFGLVRESFLITPYVEGINFHHYIRNEEVTPAQKRHIVEQIKGILNTLAHNKISHGDSKLSNFLVAGEDPVVTDLDSMKVRWSGVMAKRGAKNDLARFMLGINTDDISADMRQICATVCGYSGPLPYDFTTNYFKIPAAKNNCWNMLIRRGFNPQDATAIIEGGVCRDENRYIRYNSSKMTRLWTSTACFRGRDINIFIKEHLPRSAGDFVKSFVRDSRGMRAFKASLMLRNNGLDCPEPLALLERWSGRFCADSILVTVEIIDGKKFNTRLRKLVAEGTNFAELEKRDILRRLGEHVGKMHGAGIFHGDLRTGNILLQGEPGKIRFYLVDNERTRKFDVIPERLVVKNLVQLNMFRLGITNTDRMRFLGEYIKQRGLPESGKNRLCRLVIRLTDKRLRTRCLHHGIAQAL
jgi:tRNA A-37 threonylcarbamoyl transferase component Bud32